MKDVDLKKYSTVTSRMRDLSGYIITLFGSGPAVGHQLFLCRDLKAPLSDAAWGKFIAANDGKLPKEVAAWEEWQRFPDRTGYSRYYGLGNKEEDMEAIQEVIDEGYDLLKKYETLDDLPSQLEWHLPNPVRCLMGCVLEDYHCFVDLVCRGAGESVPERNNIVGLQEAGLEMIAVDDFVEFMSSEIGSWVQGLEGFDIEEDVDPTPEVTSVKIVGVGQTSFELDGGICTTFPIPRHYEEFFAAFVVNAFTKRPEDVVGWKILNDLMQVSEAGHASDKLRAKNLRFNRRLGQWGHPRDRKNWIVTETEVGLYLNRSCHWTLDEALQKQLSRRSQSVYGLPTDPETMEENTPDRGQSLPPPSRRPTHQPLYEKNDDYRDDR